MKATTSIAVIAAWIWIFQGCDTKGHQTKDIAKTETNHQENNKLARPISTSEHLALAVCNK